MPDNDYNIIKPVETLQNVAGLTPAKRRKQKKRRSIPEALMVVQKYTAFGKQ